MLLLPLIARTALFSFLALNLFACGDSGSDPYRSNSTEGPVDLSFAPDLKPYFDAYVADAEAAGVAVPEQVLQEFRGLMWTQHISLKNSNDAKILGHCQRRISQHLRFVEILRPNAEQKVGHTLVDDITLKVMVYHELGHCLHDFDGHTSGQSAAVMNAYLQPARYFDLESLLQDHFKMLKRMREDPTYKP